MSRKGSRAIAYRRAYAASRLSTKKGKELKAKTAGVLKKVGKRQLASKTAKTVKAAGKTAAIKRKVVAAIKEKGAKKLRGMLKKGLKKVVTGGK